MKRSLLCLLLSLLILCAACIALAEAEEEETLSYSGLITYVEELFGFEDLCYYPYLPTVVDPVNYFGYIAMTGGVNGDQYYIAHNGTTAENVASYLKYLDYWGYACEPADCALPGVSAWHLTGAASALKSRMLLQELDIYHVEQHDVLVVSYPYLDAWIYDEWLIHPDWHIYDQFAPATLPCILPINDDITVTVEEVMPTDLLFLSSSEELSLSPFDMDILENRGLKISALQTPDSPYTQYVLRTQSDNKDANCMLICLRLSFDYGTRDILVRSLRAALASADETRPGSADCPDVPMLVLTQSKEDPLLFTPAQEGEKEDLWIVFPPYFFWEDETMRLYLCLEDDANPWIGDLRDWRYINFTISPSMMP